MREKPVTANDIDVSGVDNMFHQRIYDMLWKHEIVWNGRLCHTDIAEYAIGFHLSDKTLKSAPYNSEQIARNLEAFEQKSSWIRRDRTRRIRMSHCRALRP